MNTENLIKEKFGISIGIVFEGRPEVFAQHGIHYIEFRPTKDPETTAKNVEIMLDAMKRCDTHVNTIHLQFGTEYDLSSTDEETRKGAIELQIRDAKICLSMGPKIAVLHPSHGQVAREDYPARKAALIKSLKELCPAFKEMGIQIAIENLTPDRLVETSAEALEIVEAVGDNIGICFDVNHLFAEPIRDFVRNAGKHIITMHVTDNDGIVERHFIPGDGVIDWKELFCELEKIGYDSTMIAECGQVLSGFPDTVPVLAEKWVKVH